MPTLTPALLAQIMECSKERAAECFDQMIVGMRTFEINTPRRIALFFAQVKWESGGLKYFSELYSGEAYNGRADLGNTQPGDGPRFKGAGPIQITGRSNYAAASKALGLDLVANPQLARTVKYGFLISCWWWKANGGNEVADTGPIDAANVRAGRMVYRGNANATQPAKHEAERIAAFKHVQGFGELLLPGAAPSTPPPAKRHGVPVPRTVGGYNPRGRKPPFPLASGGFSEGGKNGRGNAAEAVNVRVIQRYLAAIGFYTGGVDGIAGPRFTAGVRHFQADYTGPSGRLRPDGVVDRRTWDAMGLRV